MNRWVGDELNVTIENWTLAELNEFLEDIELVDSTSTNLEFIPGSMSADQTFTAMVSSGFIGEYSEDLETYREAYPEYLEDTASAIQIFTAMQQKGFIPQGKDIDDLEEFLENKYYEYEEDIEDFLEENCEWREGTGYETWLFCSVGGILYGDIFYLHWPLLVKGAAFAQVAESGDGCFLKYRCLTSSGVFLDDDIMAMANVIWLGMFFPIIHLFENPVPRIFAGLSWWTSVYDME